MPQKLPTALEKETGWDHGFPQPQWGVPTALQRPLYRAEEREYVPELQWPQSTLVFDRMRNDGKVAEVLRALTGPVLGARRWLDPAGARPEVVQRLSANLGVPTHQGDPVVGRTRDRFDIGEHLRLALLELVYGHMFFEQVYRIVPEAGVGVYAELRKLAPRMPQTILEILTENDGGLAGIRQHAPGDLWLSTSQMIGPGVAPLIPVERLVAYVAEREGAAWQGRSMLRAAYRPWRLKDEALRTWATANRRNGMGHPVYTGAPGESEGQLTKGAGIASSARAGETAGAAVPNGASLTFQGVRGTLPDHEHFVRYQDEEIAGSVLAEFMKLGSSRSGSRALGQTFVDFFTLATRGIADHVAATFNEYVIEDLVDINWGPDEPAPRLVIEDVAADHNLTADALLALVSAGALTVDDPLEAYLRDMYRLPAVDKATARVVSAPATVPQNVLASRREQRVHAAAGDSGDDSEADPELQQVDQDWRAALAAVMVLWRARRAEQVGQLVGQVRAAAEARDLAALAGLSAALPGGPQLLVEAMGSMAATAALRCVAEAAAQGYTLSVPDVTALDAGFLARAQAIDGLLTTGLQNAAVRRALLAYGPDTDPNTVAQAVQDALDAQSDTYLRDQLGSALTVAQNEARGAVFDTAGQALDYVTAVEVLDSHICAPCGEVDGTQYPDWETARADYPNGQYRDCLGGPRCRGHLYGTYRQQAA